MVASIALFLVSWAAGVGTYIAALHVFFGQRMELTSPRNGDFRFVVISSFVAFALLFGGVYLPLLFGLRRWLRGVRPIWPFPVLAMLLGVVPTAAILAFLGRRYPRCSIPGERAILLHVRCRRSHRRVWLSGYLPQRHNYLNEAMERTADRPRKV